MPHNSHLNKLVCECKNWKKELHSTIFCLEYILVPFVNHLTKMFIKYLYRVEMT